MTTLRTRLNQRPAGSNFLLYFRRQKMQKFLYLIMVALLALPATAFAAGQEDAMISELQKQIQELSEELEDLNDRVDDAERHATLDRIEFSGDLRAKAHSLHYQDVTFNPGINVDMTKFFMDAGAGFSPTGGPLGKFNAFNPMLPANNPLPPNTPPTWNDDPNPALNPTALDNMFYGLAASNPDLYNGLLAKMGAFMADPVNNAPGVMIFPMGQPNTYDINNDILYTSRLRLNMKAKVWDNVKFSGRLLMFKNWGDSTGSQVFDSWNRFTMDATNSGNTTGDMLRVDRAYFDWSNIADSGFYLSIPRPATL
jgi:hypothetical protein